MILNISEIRILVKSTFKIVICQFFKLEIQYIKFYAIYWLILNDKKIICKVKKISQNALYYSYRLTYC